MSENEAKPGADTAKTDGAESGDSAATLGQGSKLLVDVGPAAVFMLTYNIAKVFGDGAIYWATGVFMAATALAVIWAFFVQKRTPPMLIVTFIIVTGFGAMTIYLQEPIFAYIKPTIINVLFATVILGCFAFGFNVWKALFGSIFAMPERAWYILGIRWALFFLILAGTNELLWRHISGGTVPESMVWFEGFSISETVWANFRFFGVYAMFAVFVALNIPITMKYARDPETGEAFASSGKDED